MSESLDDVTPASPTNADAHGEILEFSSKRGRSRGLLYGILLVIVAESVGVHALLYRRWPWASALLLAVNAWTIWWLVREFSAREPTLVRQDDLLVRVGRSIAIEVPLHLIRDARRPSWQEIPEGGTSGYLSLARGDDPNVLLQLDPPLSARLTFGIRKQIAILGAQLDEPERFVSIVNARRAARAARGST